MEDLSGLVTIFTHVSHEDQDCKLGDLDKQSTGLFD